jgi:hypothetical protein
MTMMRWYPDYQTRDRDIVDYHEFSIRGCDARFRGPGLDPFVMEPRSYFTCLGAAQTYGCYCNKPYPTLLSEVLGLPVLNLAVGGAGPGFYLQHDSLLEAINRGRFVIIQCMAARQESNSRFEADGHVEFLKDRNKGDSVTSAIAWRRIVDEEPDGVLKYVDETRASWLASSRKLIARLSVPALFFWFSRRERDYVIDDAAIRAQTAARARGEDGSHFIDALSGDFPHFVDGPCARMVATLCDADTECLSSRGIGRPLVHRLTGEPIEVDMAVLGADFAQRRHTHNHYYPSAEMHEDACAALLPAVREMLAKTHEAPPL